MKNFFTILIVSFAFFPLLLHAIIIRVPQDYPTIQQGIDAANGGDIVVVAPGTYNEEITLKADVVVRGTGEGLSIIDGGGNSGDVVFASGNDIDNDTKFQGFTVTGAVSGGSMPGGAGIFCNSGAKPDISNNRVEGNDFGIATWNQSNAYIHNNVVVNQNFDGIVISADPVVINNTVVGNRIGINDGGGYGATVMNNIVTSSTLYGVYAVGTPPVLTYNNVWNNATNYQNCSPGTGSISADPLYVDPPNDFHLQTGSPCIDSGNPAAQYNDPDGSRNDMGAYGGPGATADFPVVLLTIPAMNEQNIYDTVSASAMFNLDMDPVSFTVNTTQIHGKFTGFISSTITYDTTARFVTIDPDSTFHCGEIVTAVLTKDIRTPSGDSLEGFIWQFVCRVDSGSGLFTHSDQYMLGDGPLDGVTGDFYRDDNLDVAFANYYSDEVSVLIGNGDGTFATAVNYPVGSEPTGICTGNFNFNVDPWLDLAVTNEGSNDVSILLGNGDGTFTVGSSYAADIAPQGICCGDFNCDGLLDIAVVNRNSGTVSILIGDGNGTFSGPMNYTVGGSPLRIVCGDFNNDGYLDVVTTNSTTNNISILLGDGTGGFGAVDNFSVGTNPHGVYSADFNGDGDIDIATANFDSDNVSRLLGNGDGTFGSAVHFAAGDGPSGIYATDHDADGNHDLAVSNVNANTVSILLGNGNGGFATATHFITGSSPSCLLSGDFDNDRDMDIVTGDYSVDSMSVLLNEAALNVTASDPAQYDLGVVLSTNIEATFNLDVDTTTLSDTTFRVYGSQSGIHAGSISYSAGTRTVTLDPDANFYDGEIATAVLTKELQSQLGPYLDGHCWQFTAEVSTQSDGTFENPLNFTAGNQPRGLFAGDFDGDWDIDIAATSNPNSVVVLLNNGDGTFAAPVYTSIEGDPIALFGADFDSDGDIDLASAHNQPGTSHLVILKNNGSGVFTVFATYAPAILGQNLSGGDIDADGDIDLVMTDGWGSGTNVRVMLNNGNGSYSGPYTYTAGTWARGVAIKDVDNDGDLDLGVTNAGNDNISILSNDGDGNFPEITNYAVGDNPTAVYGNDFNGDNYVDFATANYSGNDIAVILNNGDGTFSNPTGYATGNNTRALHGGDFDGDGDIDLTGSNNGTNTVAVLLNNGDGTYGNLATYTVGTSPWGIMSADYDLDGALDIACGNYNSNNVTVLYNTGTGVLEHGLSDIVTQLSIYPNPFKQNTIIRCQILNTTNASLKIYDVTGRLIRVFNVDPYDMNESVTSVSWNGTDELERVVPNGVYFCQLNADNRTLTRQIVLVR